jgi:hypothetical protein
MAIFTNKKDASSYLHNTNRNIVIHKSILNPDTPTFTDEKIKYRW